jgi:hypothetical protein
MNSGVAFTSSASRLVTRNSVTSPRSDPNMIPVLQLAGDRGQPVGGHHAVLLGLACTGRRREPAAAGMLIQRRCAHDPLIPPRTPAGQGTRQSAPWPSQDPPSELVPLSGATATISRKRPPQSHSGPCSWSRCRSSRLRTPSHSRSIRQSSTPRRQPRWGRWQQ